MEGHRLRFVAAFMIMMVGSGLGGCGGGRDGDPLLDASVASDAGGGSADADPVDGDAGAEGSGGLLVSGSSTALGLTATEVIYFDDLEGELRRVAKEGGTPVTYWAEPPLRVHAVETDATHVYWLAYGDVLGTQVLLARALDDPGEPAVLASGEELDARIMKDDGRVYFDDGALRSAQSGVVTMHVGSTEGDLMDVEDGRAIYKEPGERGALTWIDIATGATTAIGAEVFNLTTVGAVGELLFTITVEPLEPPLFRYRMITIGTGDVPTTRLEIESSFVPSATVSRAYDGQFHGFLALSDPRSGHRPDLLAFSAEPEPPRALETGLLVPRDVELDATHAYVAMERIAGSSGGGLIRLAR